MNKFTQRLTENSGIVSLMEDLGEALNSRQDLIMMGGGNPAAIEGVESIFNQHWRLLADSEDTFHKLVGDYQPPQGDPELRTLLADYLNRNCGWQVSKDNIAVANGAQSVFFTLFNMLGGGGKKILLPLVPDYLGYADAGLDDNMFTSLQPNIQFIDDVLFKYRIDFDQIEIDPSISAVCLSRPTNPSGNIVSDEEIKQLQQICQTSKVPLIVDLAYGKPFPNATFVDHHLDWDNNMIAVLSLSKLGLPGLRTGFIVANPDVIQRFSRATASMALAPGNTGPMLLKSLLKHEVLNEVTKKWVQPYYADKSKQVLELVKSLSKDLPVFIHKPEGAFFLWIWFKDLPVTSQVLYESLKAKGLLILSGHHFFESLDDREWMHQYQCVRLSYCQPWHLVEKGLSILFDEINDLYASDSK